MVLYKSNNIFTEHNNPNILISYYDGVYNEHCSGS